MVDLPRPWDTGNININLILRRGRPQSFHHLCRRRLQTYHIGLGHPLSFPRQSPFRFLLTAQNSGHIGFLWRQPNQRKVVVVWSLVWRLLASLSWESRAGHYAIRSSQAIRPRSPLAELILWQ